MSFVKSIFVFITVSLSLSTYAQSDSVAWKDRKFIKQFDIGAEALTGGYGFATVDEKVKDFPYGMNYFLQNPKGGGAFSGFGLLLSFRDKFVVQFNIINLNFYTINNTNFTAYLQNKFPAYYVPSGDDSFGYRLQYDFSAPITYFIYRMHFKRWLVEPNLSWVGDKQILPTTYYNLHELGTNNFLEYSVKETNYSTANLFGLGANLFYRTKNLDGWSQLEFGLKAQYCYGKIKCDYLITESPYLQPTTVNTFASTYSFSDFKISLALRLFFSK